MGLLPLLVFKYYNFLNDSLSEVLESCGLHFALPGLYWAIPVGISFFTFQAVGYLLDVYHKRVPAEKNFLDYALFVSFFPQVTSGPISTAKDLMPQFKTPHAFMYNQARAGLQLLLWGMFMKMVVADRLGIYVDKVYDSYMYQSSLTCVFAACLYSIQIYADFAGYSLMAIGIARTIGFDLINNFERPYCAASITEFWKLWHISLTRWLTTHVYINLGGNRCSNVRQYWNIMATFLVSGLWHGANWTFVVWGAIHGVLQIVEKALGIAPKGKHYDKIEGIRILKPLRIAITFALVTIAWVFFRMPSFEMTIDFFRQIATSGSMSLFSPAPDTMLLLIMALVCVVLKDFCEETLPQFKLMNNKHWYIRWTTYTILCIWILLGGVFDASNFIYANF